MHTQFKWDRFKIFVKAELKNTNTKRYYMFAFAFRKETGTKTPDTSNVSMFRKETGRKTPDISNVSMLYIIN